VIDPKKQKEGRSRPSIKIGWGLPQRDLIPFLKKKKKTMVDNLLQNYTKFF